MREGRQGAQRGQERSARQPADSLGLNENDLSGSFENRLFALLERIAVAVEGGHRPDRESQIDRAIGLLFQCGSNVAEIARRIGEKPTTVRSWPRFMEQRNLVQSMNRGLDKARMTAGDYSDEVGDE